MGEPNSPKRTHVSRPSAGRSASAPHRLLFASALLALVAAPPLAAGCFSIVAGKAATADGSVLFGHNEDNGPDDVAGMASVPRAAHAEGEWVILPGGGRIPQKKETFAYWRLQMPGLPYSDVLLNEHGVAIASNNCPSREDRPALDQGGIGGPILRRLVAERARTAREGAALVGSLLERFGYTASGRTLILCGPSEGWLVAMVRGKHWVAARVPDDRVAMVANTYTIGRVDLADRRNFLGSPDLVDYAVHRGWYDPARGPFRFEAAYADRRARVAPANTHRQWSGLRRLAAEPIPDPDRARLPFTVKPRAPLTVRAIAEVLRDHYEGTPFRPPPGHRGGSPHRGHTATICSPRTNSSSIFRLRAAVPAEMGRTWWLALGQPCSSPYLPLHPGLQAVPAPLGFGTKGMGPAASEGGPWPVPGPAYRTFRELARWVDAGYDERAPIVRACWERTESEIQWIQAAFEAKLLAAGSVPSAPIRRDFTRSIERAVARVVAEADRWMRGELLWNGIRLPAAWPPRIASLDLEPMAVPYLASPPPVIPIDVGRQLFVDDFLVERTTLKRTFHTARYHPEGPVLRPDRPWEQGTSSHGHPAPTAMVFSDGVWYDPRDRLFKAWYMGGYVRSTCYAVSRDGIRWEKPELDVRAGTNVVHEGRRDSATVWLDLEEEDPARRFKLFVARRHEGGWALAIHVSRDGIHWGDPAIWSGPCGDRTTVFYNPFRKVWVYSLRDHVKGLGRVRRYREARDPIEGARWKSGEPTFWVGADRLDPPRPDLKIRPQLYNLDAVAYESLLLGLFAIWPGQPSDRPKPNYVALGFSRDGFHWDRPDRRPFIGVSERAGDWNWGNVQSAGGCCLVVGDELYFYVSGRAGVPGSPASGVCSTGLATLRRDGFASMNAGPSGGTLTTRPVVFRGAHLFVNVDAEGGELRAEVLDPTGAPIAPFTRAGCAPIRSDTTLEEVRWRGADAIEALAGRPVRFRFHLRDGSLYAFWVSPDASGASHGYVAAGGPGFRGPTDTVGRAAYRAAR